MFASGNAIEARTFRSALLQHSREFLKALPIPGLGLTMSPKDFRLSVTSYLGIILFPRESLCTVCHSAPNDVYGLYASNCRTTARHERLKHLLKSIAVEANLSAITEPNGLLPNSDDRPGPEQMSLGLYFIKSLLKAQLVICHFRGEKNYRVSLHLRKPKSLRILKQAYFFNFQIAVPIVIGFIKLLKYSIFMITSS
jgi:hypothetical protein